MILRMYHELPHEQIAAILGSSVGAVKANFFHALANLKKLLQRRRPMTIRGRHLAEPEFVDALDGTLAPRPAAHVASCPACAAQVEDLRAIAAGRAQADVPEPPPFFWNQLSARVRARSPKKRPPGRASLAWPRWAFAAAAGIAVVVLAVVSLRNSPEDASVAAPGAVTPDGSGADAGARRPGR